MIGRCADGTLAAGPAGEGVSTAVAGGCAAWNGASAFGSNSDGTRG
jgi:hypothetical protein